METFIVRPTHPSLASVLTCLPQLLRLPGPENHPLLNAAVSHYPPKTSVCVVIPLPPSLRPLSAHLMLYWDVPEVNMQNLTCDLRDLPPLRIFPSLPSVNSLLLHTAASQCLSSDSSDGAACDSVT